MEEFEVLNEWGEFTGDIKTREECHAKGYFHKAVVMFVINQNGTVLIQQRSNNKKLWPGKWDITAGGHVLKGEFGYQAVIREAKEEIGIDISENDLLFIGSTISENIQGEIVNRHFNEYYIVTKNILLEDLVLQHEEVQDIKWISKEEIIEMINKRDDSLTSKWSCWDYLKKYLETLN